jgi:transposase
MRVKTGTVYRASIALQDDREAQQAESQQQGLFVLLTSRIPDERYPASRVLADYQGQEVVEAGFRWIKSPGQVAPLLLHTPARIESLAFLFTVTLLLYRLLQREIRRALSESEQTVPGPNRVPTRRPTTRSLMRLFHEVYLVRIQTDAGSRTRLVGWKPVHDQVLALLGLPPDLYHPQKIRTPP